MHRADTIADRPRAGRRTLGNIAEARRGRWYAGAIAALFGLIAGWLSLREQKREYTLGSVGYAEPPPATLHGVLDERFPPKPEQSWITRSRGAP